MKLYDEGNAEEAFVKLLAKQKMNETEKDLLIKIHADRIAQDEQIIDRWMQSDSLEVWPRVSGRLEKIETIQNEIYAVAEKQAIPIAQFASFKNLDTKLELANEKAAEYYYQRQQQEYQDALKGSKKAARRGYDLGNRIFKYQEEYKDAGATNEILKDIGTDYIVMIYDSSYLRTPEIISLETMITSWGLPETQFWSELSNNAKDFTRVDFWLDIAPAEVGISQPIWVEDRCINSKEIEVGTNTVEEWSEADSAYVQREVPIIETVSVEVINYEQIRTGELPFRIQLFKNGDQRAFAKKEQSVKFSWSNEFGEAFGDERAIELSCCPDSGWEENFPSEKSILRKLGDRMKGPIQEFLVANMETYEK